MSTHPTPQSVRPEPVEGRDGARPGLRQAQPERVGGDQPTRLLPPLLAALRAGRGFAHKRDIARVMQALDSDAPSAMSEPTVMPTHAPTTVPNGDDCAVLPLPGGGHQLLAIEGLMPDFVQQQPWFAGYSAVMVNLSDVAAMGGRPTAVVDALWSADEATTAELLRGMRAACAQYGVPLVGGHTNLRSGSAQLAVAVLGRAERLISSFAARPGDRLLVATDLRGAWQGDAPFWNASTNAPAARLQADLALLPQLAEAGLLDAGKDISMAGVLGTLLMLLECSGCGARVALDHLPCPTRAQDGLDWHEQGDEAQARRMRWLSAFPSFGFVLAVRRALAAEVQARFSERGIACADVGEVQAGTRLDVALGEEQACLWDLAESGFILGGPATSATVPTSASASARAPAWVESAKERHHA
ncbi:MAG: sll0787 family AIR synthase-like protein [Pseudacidovorax sp.]|nr:sll0787 family AIR synthase-like protein [Pseudacidovorax sp.]